MSQKWVRAKQWDAEHLRGVLLPVRIVLRVFSSIPLAIVTLFAICLYGTLASVPLGLLLQIPTYLIVVLSLLVTIALVGMLPTWALSRGLSRTSMSGAGRFLVAFATLAALGTLGVWGWLVGLWPAMRYDPTTGAGLMLFADHVEMYKSTTVRRLPGVEMSELEFYGWWPMRVMLYVFILNLLVATVRRIEFKFLNIGVLTVHTGIIVMALGSIYYKRLKQEGDTVLFAAQGTAETGPVENGFFDNTDVSLWIKQAKGWEERPLTGIPRYNEYGLDAAWPDAIADEAGVLRDQLRKQDNGRRLSRAVPTSPGVNRMRSIDEDLRFEVVGYAPYADRVEGFLPLRPDAPGGTTEVRTVDLLFDNPNDDLGLKPVATLEVFPERPRDRLSLSVNGRLGLEFTKGMSAQRWRDLSTEVPLGSPHALIVEVAATGDRVVMPIQKDTAFQIGGYRITVSDILPEPPFPIITPGFEGATSSLAIVSVVPPSDALNPEPFDRWVYHRFPEINQDLLSSAGAGMPPRRAADPSIRIAYLDMSILQVYYDEHTLESGAKQVRAIARVPNRLGLGNEERMGQLYTADNLKQGDIFSLDERFAMRLGVERQGVVTETPMVTPAEQRKNDLVGNHKRALMAVRIWSEHSDGASDWERTVWLPFVDYIGIDMPGETDVELPDGRTVRLAFGRRRHSFPNFMLSLFDFEMIPYPHSDTPRDYRSDLVVYTLWDDTPQHTKRETSLNRPLLLRVPFQRRDDLTWAHNLAGWIVTSVAPNQYKFSQAGWDADGWKQSMARVETGELEKPEARWTILGVGNNPGIYVIAVGAVLFSLGVPWAFWIKPIFVQRRKRQLAAEAKARVGAPTKAKADASASKNGRNGTAAGAEASADPDKAKAES